jgi:hypothetical protein
MFLLVILVVIGELLDSPDPKYSTERKNLLQDGR